VALLSVFAYECQPLLREGLERVLERSGEFRLVGWATDPAVALARVHDLKPRLVVVGQTSSGEGPGWRSLLQLLGEMRQVSPETQAVLSVRELLEADCYRALQMGVRGVFKTTLPVEDLVDCLRAVSVGDVWLKGAGEAAGRERNARGKARLTPRERDVVHLVARGLKNREIAEQLEITAGTVKVHLMHVFEKTGVKDRFELSVRARTLLGEDGERGRRGQPF